MSKDIRSYFTLAGSGKKKETKNVETKVDKTKPQKKKRIAVISDSDDEDVPAPVKKQKSTNEKCSKYFKEAKKPVVEKAHVELKPIKAADVFGCDKVKRSANKTPKEEVVEVPAQNAKGKRVPVVTLDDGKDSDLDFEATLSQLDEIEARANEEFLRESQGSREEGEGGEKPTGPANGIHEKREKFEDDSIREKRKHHTTKTKEPDSHETSKRRESENKKKHGIEYLSGSDEDEDRASRRNTTKTKEPDSHKTSKHRESENKKKHIKNLSSSDEDEDGASRRKTMKTKEPGSRETSKGRESENKKKHSIEYLSGSEEEEDGRSRRKTKKRKKKKAEEDEVEDKPSKGKTKKTDVDEDEPSREKTKKKEADEVKPNREKTKKKKVDEEKPSRGKGKQDECSIRKTKKEDEPSREKGDEPKKNKKTEDPEDQPHWATDPAERRRISAIGYQRYLQREGPKHLGAKDIPTGTPDSLAGLTFVITGVLDSIERDDAVALVVGCGGRVVSGVSRNTSYLVVGEDAGPAKVAKAEKLGTRTINEDELFDLVRTRSGLGKTEPQRAAEPEKSKQVSEPEKSKRVSDFQKVEPEKSKRVSDPQKAEPKTSKRISEPEKSERVSKPEKSERVSEPEKSKKVSESASKPSSQRDSPWAERTPPKPKTESSGPSQPPKHLPPSLLWVDKYRPTNIKNIIGQQGDKSNVKKLLNWLQNWHRNQFGGKKLVKPSPWARDDDGAFFKAALLSGPPGVGKTTSAHLVSKELGFDIVEFNASDTRSKRLLHEEVSELLSNKSLNDYFRGSHGKTTSKHVLLMDEVDGMAGNEDRGGMQELIQLIKNSKVPVLCMCNDVHHQKIRSLLGHCFDLRFQKPRVEQIRGAMQSVCFKEGFKIPPDLLTDMITGSNQDVRQVLHHLSLYSAKVSGTTTVVSKHVKLGPWDVMKKVFSADEHRTMSIMDKSDLFFHDYNISPLFVQENYLSVLPDAARNNAFKRLELIAQAADSICMGDTVERCIRSKNSWSLLPVQAMYASVIPGDLLEGHMTAQINFPSWLGKNSRRNKFDRLLQELHSHTRLRVTGNKQSLNLDYLPRLREAITRPLIREGGDGVPEAITVMQAYHLLRSDLDSIIELSVWPGEQDPMSKVDSKVKAAMTRTYNKDLVLPYSTAMTVSKKKSVALTAEGDEDDEEEEEEDEDDLSADAMIKAKKRPAAKKEPTAGPSAAKRGRGRGKK